MQETALSAVKSNKKTNELMPLYIVATPIGHEEDITLRAVNILKSVDFVICEEWKEGRKLLKKLEIEKELFQLNEHNEEENTPEITEMLSKGKSGALISDCGTPLFADPGTHLTDQCYQKNIPIVPIPGPSSLTAALSISGLNIKQFFYAGFLARKSEDRVKEIESFRHLTCPVVLFDTPYRIRQLLQDLIKVLSPELRGLLAMSLTQEGEDIRRDSLKNLLKQMEKNPVKKEFVLILDAPKLKKEPFKKKKKVQTRSIKALKHR